VKLSGGVPEKMMAYMAEQILQGVAFMHSRKQVKVYEPYIRALLGTASHPASSTGRELFIDNLLVRNRFSIVMMRWTGLAPWEVETPFPGSLTSTLLQVHRDFKPCNLLLDHSGSNHKP